MMQIAHKQRGVALIIVLLIVAIVSVLATEMGSRLQLQVKRASNIKESNQAYWYAMGAEQYARKSINLLMEKNGAKIQLDQPWSQEFVYPIQGGGIQAQLIDMQACFNLNALRDKGNTAANASTNATGPIAIFGDLLNKADLQIAPFNVETLRDSLADWLDDDDIIQGYGAEDSDYESLRFPYLAANNFMAHKSELRMVNGVELKWFDKLMPLLCVIPGSDLLQINVNTVSAENAAVLAAVTGLNVVQAKTLISNRPPEGYDSVADFTAEKEFSGVTLTQEQESRLDVTTKHFILHTKTKYNNATFAMVTVFFVDPSNKVTVLRREFGGI
ncbi:MAG: general secretion pathway protein K [Paraglaciecola sp.]|jgi:general secretion pathway protein K